MSYRATPTSHRPWWVRVLRASPLILFLLEVIVIIVLAQLIGWWTLLALLVFSAAGMAVISRTSRRSFQDFREMSRTGRTPSRSTTDDVITLVGGALLLVPGFITGVLGLALVVPFTRALTRRLLAFLAAKHVLQAMGVRFQHGSVIHGEVVTEDGSRPFSTGTETGPDVIEGRIVDDDDEH